MLADAAAALAARFWRDRPLPLLTHAPLFLLPPPLPPDEASKDAMLGVEAQGADGGKPAPKVKPNQMWPLLADELGLTHEQKEKLKQGFKVQDTTDATADRQRLEMIVKFLRKVGRGMETRGATVQAQSEALHKILTPEQRVHCAPPCLR